MSEVPLHGLYGLPCLVRTILLLDACFSGCDLQCILWLEPYDTLLQFFRFRLLVWISRALTQFDRLVHIVYNNAATAATPNGGVVRGTSHR